MLIVRLVGGLCNQIYGYMAGFALAKELKQELVLDIEECIHSAFGYSLDYFKIPSARKMLYSWDVILTSEQGFYDRLLETFTDAVILVQSDEQKREYMDNDRIIIYTGLGMADELRGHRNLYMPGYFFEREKYYEKYWLQLRRMFVLKEEKEDIKNFRKMIAGKNSVGVHIRRRDMLLVDWSYKVEDDYYRAAIAYCRKLYDNCAFYIFSDDIAYARKMLGADNDIYYVHFYGYDNASVNEFCCLSLCNHRILTIDSTFGQLADDLSEEKDGHVFIRDRVENTRGGHSQDRNKKRWIFLNREDIRQYGGGYRLIDNKEPQEDSEQAYHRFLELRGENRNHEALQIAFCIYHEKKDDMEFKRYLAELLIKIGVYEEALIELVQQPQDIVDRFFREFLLEGRRKKHLLHLYHELCNARKKHFVIIMREKTQPYAGYDDTYGLIDLAIILSHLGHKATVVYDAGDSGESCIEENTYLYNVRGINMECFYVGKNSVLRCGILDFYKNFVEEELFIISRDERFFIRDDSAKKLCFITTDATDLKDREVLAMLSNHDAFRVLEDKADIVLTQDKELADKNGKHIYWQDRGFKEKFIFIEYPWEYGYGRRLNQRMIGMAETLVNVCCKEK